MPTLGKTKVSPSLISSGSFTGSFLGTASYSSTASYAMNGGGGGSISLQTGSIANQTILYNVTTSQDNTITGLSLAGNKWGVSVVEEWNSASIVGDIYYNSCSLLLHFSGSDGSTTFTDNSPNVKSLTSNNGAKITSSIYKFGNSSLFLDGTDDYVTVTDSSDFDFGSGDFTVEYWEYRTNTTSQSPILSRNTITYTPYLIGWNDVSSPTTLVLYMSSNGSSWDVSNAASMGTIITNAWTHYAVTRQGSTFRTFQNGTQISTFTSAAILPVGSGTLQIGRFGTTYYFKGGYIDELRITKGVARYTGSFTTSSAEFANNLNVTQYATKYIGLVGGLNDSTVDYGVEKLSDSSLKIRKMSATGQPLSGSGALSASVDRVYVNVLNYDNVSISGSINNAITSSYALTSSYTSGVGSINGTQLAKAWVNFDGTGTVTIRDNYNVSSITDNGVGDYTVNYSTALNNSNYCANASARNFGIFTAAAGTITTSSIRLNTYNSAATITDSTHVFLSIFSN